VPMDKAIISEKDLVLPQIANCVNPFEYKG
jgi:dTDP-4-dehydrorhamnose 3,5-epimerase